MLGPCYGLQALSPQAIFECNAEVRTCQTCVSFGGGTSTATSVRWCFGSESAVPGCRLEARGSGVPGDAAQGVLEDRLAEGAPVVEHDAGLAVAALDYLPCELDTYHYRTVVYDDLESGGARYSPSGWMRGPTGWNGETESRFTITHPSEGAHSGATCMRIEWRPERDDEWAGVYWQYPDKNWGEFRGLDLSGATQLTFWARGETGCEVVEFKFAGIDCRAQSESDHPNESRAPCNFVDSSKALTTRTVILSPMLATILDQLALPKTVQRDWRVRVGGDSVPNPGGTVIYLDDIEIHHSRLHEPRLIRSYYAGTDPLTSKGDCGDVRQLRNACYVQDNALAICAFLASPRPADHQRARIIANAFVRLAESERLLSERENSPTRQFPGLRLRNAYSCGDLFEWHSDNKRNAYSIRLPGKFGRDDQPRAGSRAWQEDDYARGTDTGTMAWAILALLNVWEANGTNR